jgi:putative ABC transport system permease protein
MMFMMNPLSHRKVSIRVAAGVPMQRLLNQIEDSWKDIVPNYPMQSNFLDETFEGVFQIVGLMTQVPGSFALMALMLSLIGLFGLAAFIAQNHPREIGIRKMMGANTGQIVGLLIWQFSRPVLWSLLVALPLAYSASTAYLNFFAERIGAPTMILLGSGVMAVLFARASVSVRAIRIARANPIRALRYE